jgi:GNAT superfamily N-acetyltransferase
MPPVIRPYSPDDLAAGRRLWAELTAHHREIYLDPTIGGDDPGAYFDTYLQSPGLVGPWVAVVDGEVVGLTGLLPHWGDWQIEPVVVAASHRARGIGRALVDRAIAEARAAGARDITVRPVARNVEAIAFFVRAGFTMLGQIDLSLDLSGAPSYDQRPGITLHGHRLKY